MIGFTNIKSIYDMQNEKGYFYQNKHFSYILVFETLFWKILYALLVLEILNITICLYVIDLNHFP